MTAMSYLSLLPRRAILALFVVAATAVAASAKDPIPTLEQALKDKGPVLIEYLRTNKLNNVGVLNFLVGKDGKEPNSKVGAINVTLANRLEIALILADDVNAPINIIHNASAVAAKLPGANHKTPEGRAVLFNNNYPLSWGQNRVKPVSFSPAKP